MDFYLSMIYRDIMPIAPKASRRKTKNIKDKYSFSWVFLANKDTLNAPISCRSLETLCKMANDYTYITPNGFWHNRQRNKLTLRSLNAFVLDYDDLIDPDIVLSKITRSGLPSPTFLNQTDSGIHAWWVFEKPERVYSKKVISLYDGIHRDMVYAADSDKHFVRASERFVRVPKHIVWQSGALNRYSLETFKEWREINIDRSSSLAFKMLNKGAWLSSPGIQALLQMDVPDGQRGDACFTLAMAFKADGYDVESAFSALKEWNLALSEPIPEKRIWNTVSSAYRRNYHRPSRESLALFVGKELAYSKVRYITPAKPRSERSQWHLKEISVLIIKDLEENKLVDETQAEWAKRLAVPLRSFKMVLSKLRSKGIVFGIAGLGRYANSYYKLSETYLLHGPAAFIEDREEVNKDFKQVQEIQDNQNFAVELPLCKEVNKENKLIQTVSEDNGLVVDISDFQFNGAYPYIRVVSGAEGGSSSSLPRYLDCALRELLRLSLLSSAALRASPLLDTG